MIARASSATVLLTIAGFAIWGVSCNVLYGTVSLGCELGWQRVDIGPASLQRVLLIALWMLHLALHVWLIAWLRKSFAEGSEPPRTERFVQNVAVAGAWFGLAATTVTGGLVVFLSPCTP